MNQQQLNNNFIQTALYYVDQQIPGRKYDMWGADLLMLNVDQDNNLYIVSWLPTDIQEPTINDLLNYSVSNVLSFFNLNYYYPNMIFNNQPFPDIPGSQLVNIPISLCTRGRIVYDSENEELKIFNGTSWIGI